MDFYDLLLAKRLGGGGGGSSVDVEPLSVTANGTYTAPEGTAYSPVSVNVSASADYGTFVDASISGALDISSATRIKGYGMAYLTNVTSVNAPNVGIVGTYAFIGSNALTVLAFPKVTQVDSNAFREMNNLTTVDLGNTLTTIGNNAWLNSSKFQTLIIRKASVQSIANTGMFNGTRFASGGAGGTLYVPSSLISAYQSATNWSTLLGYANNQIKAIEGSIYE